MDKFIDGIAAWCNGIFTWVTHQPELMALAGTCFLMMIIFAILSDN